MRQWFLNLFLEITMFHTHDAPGQPKSIIAPIEGTKAITVLILVGAGSRYESLKERGIAHFLEHMFFKGGAKYTSPLAVSETIDSIGGEFNAFTGKEYAGYYVKCASEKKEVAFDVLSDMLLNAKLADEDVMRESGVILEELNMYQDTPLYQIGWNFESLLFGDTPLGRDQIGVPETITAFRHDDFVTYKKDLYTPDNTIVVLAGDITEDEGKELIGKYFPMQEGRAKARDFDSYKQAKAKHVDIRSKKTEQGHLMLGYHGAAFGHEDNFPLRLLSIILGGNMSSRMFLKIREEKGLCYSVRCMTDQYSDAGSISVYAGVDLRRSDEAIQAIMAEYRLAAEDGVTEKELEKAKNYLKGILTLKMEDSEERASFLGAQAIVTGEIKSLEEVFAKIDKITVERVNDVAKKYLTGDCYLAAIGPFEGKEQDFEGYIA